MPITRRRRANPPDQPENNNNHFADQTNDAAESLATEHAEQASTTSVDGDSGNVHTTERERPENTPLPPFTPLPPVPNGDRGGVGERPDYMPPIEGGRRTPRGELFRRPPQLPPQLPPVMPMTSPTLQAPTHEISLPLGNLLHLAYNPGYTGADEARSILLHRLAEESKAGGRARCWNCGSIAIVYDRWNTRSKTFGEIGVAFCEICGVWSVM
jgi:hypothetical protein